MEKRRTEINEEYILNGAEQVGQDVADIVAEKNFQYLYSRSELPYIFKNADKSYLIDYVRLLRYARRRGKADEVKKYIGGYEGACTR